MLLTMIHSSVSPKAKTFIKYTETNNDANNITVKFQFVGASRQHQRQCTFETIKENNFVFAGILFVDKGCQSSIVCFVFNILFL